MTEIATRLASEGYATVSASYRLATPLAAFAPEERTRIRTHQRRTSRAGLTLARRLTGAAFEAARRDLGKAIGFLREAGPAFGLQSDKVLMIGVSAGAIAGLSLAFPPRGLPPAPAPDAVFALSGAMIQPWRLQQNAPPCLMLNSQTDKIIAPRNVALTRKRVLDTGAPVSFLTCKRGGHNAPVRALLEDADESGTPYWDHMMDLFSPSLAVA